MDISTKMIVVGVAMGVVGGAVVGLLNAGGLSQLPATILGVGLVVAAVLYVHRTGRHGS